MQTKNLCEQGCWVRVVREYVCVCVYSVFSWQWYRMSLTVVHADDAGATLAKPFSKWFCCGAVDTIHLQPSTSRFAQNYFSIYSKICSKYFSISATASKRSSVIVPIQPSGRITATAPCSRPMPYRLCAVCSRSS